MHAALVRAAFVVAATGAVAAAQPVPPAPTRWVTDDAGFLSPSARTALDQKLESYEHSTGHQVIVWIGKTLGPNAALDDWATRTFAAWKLGRAKLDDGIAMFVLADDRKIAIEVGYGLEANVPDAIASRIILDVMAPKLRAGDHDGAVTAGTDALLASIDQTSAPPSGGAARSGVTRTGMEPAPRRPLSTGEKVLALIGLIVLVIFCITHPRLALFLLWTIMARGGGGGGGGGGGFGGGGGRSGGGGARGGW